MSTTHRRSEVTRRDFLATVAAALTLPRAAPPHARRLPQPTLAERLGYPADARLLIVHLDDLGLLHAVNAAAVVAFETGVANSGSLMVPCPWFAEAAAYARAHPQLDLGLHLTFTSERPSYRWGPVLGPAAVPSLLDGDGYFPTAWDETRRLDLRELEAELRAQLDRPRLLGGRPTPLDSHAHRRQR